MKKTLTLVLVLFVFGCSTPQRKVVVHTLENKQSSIVTYPADLRGAYLPTSGSGLNLCAEPAPDIALQTIQKLTADLTLKDTAGDTGTLKVTPEFSDKVIELAGRTQLVLLARETLYRACELSLNYPDSDLKTALAMYNAALGMVIKLGNAEVLKAETERAKLEAEILKNTGRHIDDILKKK